MKAQVLEENLLQKKPLRLVCAEAEGENYHIPVHGDSVVGWIEECEDGGCFSGTEVELPQPAAEYFSSWYASPEEW